MSGRAKRRSVLSPPTFWRLGVGGSLLLLGAIMVPFCLSQAVGGVWRSSCHGRVRGWGWRQAAAGVAWWHGMIRAVGVWESLPAGSQMVGRGANRAAGRRSRKRSFFPQLWQHQLGSPLPVFSGGLSLLEPSFLLLLSAMIPAGLDVREKRESERVPRRRARWRAPG